MSLDVYLRRDNTEFATAADLCEEHGMMNAAKRLRESQNKVLYASNITHNLGVMAKEAGIYEALWRPEERGITKAKQLIPLLEDGLKKLNDNPAYYSRFNASNGWGLYEHFVPWVKDYLEACKEHPYAIVEVSR